jgi:putative ABC transport system ATP-binding protein
MKAHHPSNSVFLETVNLTRVVGEAILVENISIQVPPGDVLAIVGPSGAGKSTFLRLLNRLDEPTKGKVYLEGRDYQEIPPRELRRRLGMVMQLPFLFPGTVAQNISFGPHQHGETISQDQIEKLLNRVGLAGYAERDIHNLSGGEAQRVSLARTLANSPKALLLDEPTSALDEASQNEVELLVKSIIQQENLTCLIVTHDMAQARRMAKRAMFMREGHVVKIGSIEETLNA